MENRSVLKSMIVLAVLVTVGIVGHGQGFGFGGGMAAAFFPDMSGVNAYLSENGMPSFGDFLIGAGGGGRGGLIGGISVGGTGWGIFATSETDERSAELVFGGGGFDLGYAIGGDDGSVLTVGTVFGAGVNSLTLSFEEIEPSGMRPAGIVVGPVERELGRVFGFIEPYVSLEAQLLSWLGVELRVGYVLPLIGFDYGDLVGIPAPSLDLAGPMVSLGIVFGGIGGPSGEARDRGEVTTTSEGAFVLQDLQLLSVKNTIGDIVVTTYQYDPTQTQAARVVKWATVETYKKSAKDAPRVEQEETPDGVFLRSAGSGRVDYRIEVPSGTSLELHDGAGRIDVGPLSAESVVAEMGVGEVVLDGLDAMAAVAAVGVGSIRIVDLDVGRVVAHIGLGEVVAELPADTSTAVTVSVGLGSITFDDFPIMSGGTHGFLAKAGVITLGDGVSQYSLSAGLGDIFVRVLTP